MLYNIVILKMLVLDLDNCPVQCRLVVQAVRQKSKTFLHHIFSICFESFCLLGKYHFYFYLTLKG